MDAVCPTSVQEQVAEFGSSTDVAITEDESTEDNWLDLYKFDHSLFPETPVRKKLTRSAKRQQCREFAQEKEATQLRPESIDKNSLAALQQADHSLQDARRQAEQGDGPYVWEDGLLTRQKKDADSDVHSLLVLPQVCRPEVLRMAHSTPVAGHFGQRKTFSRLLYRFDWPGMRSDVAEVCKSCPRCQKTTPLQSCRAPLQPLPVIDVPFKRMAMDIFGPLKRTKR